MLTGEAKALARRWVEDEAAALPGFRGAFFHGSTTWLPEDATLPPTSDVDVMIVLDGAAPLKLGKFRYHELLLEVSFLAAADVRSPEQVLSTSHLAGSFRRPSVIADPTGELRALQAAVGRDFARRRWVRARCADAERKILNNFRALETPAPLHDHTLAWLFGTGITTHVLLVAGLQNPTVRRRYVAARELLEQYGQPELYEELLQLLGCAAISPQRVAHHLAALADLFDAAAAIIRTPFFFASDLSAAARPIAIDGSQALIDQGLHREAIFWIVATACRCHKVLAADAAEATQARFRPAFTALLADLGIAGQPDMAARSCDVVAFLPRLRAAAEQIIAANPEAQPDDAA